MTRKMTFDKKTKEREERKRKEMDTKKKLVILDGYAVNPGDLSWAVLLELASVDIYPRTNASLTVERLKDADMALTNKVVIDEKIMEQLPKLKYIGVLATGYNVVDTDAAARHGITVTNIPAYSTDSVVQMTMAHLLNMTNRIDHYAREARQGVWTRSEDFCYWNTPLMELAGKTLGIVGLGNIGMRVAKLAVDMGMEVLALTSKTTTELPQELRKATLEGLLAASDVVTLHCPLTPSTRHMIDQRALSLMKRGALLINTGRGPLVDEQAVAEALHSGQLGGYAADVTSTEPPTADNPLLAEPNAYLTPHIAWATPEARARLIDIATKNVKAFIEGKPKNTVALPKADTEDTTATPSKSEAKP